MLLTFSRVLLLLALIFSSSAQGTPPRLVVDHDTSLTNASSSPHGLCTMGEKVFFFAHDATHGPTLYSYDPTGAGTTLVKTLYPSTNPETLVGDPFGRPVATANLMFFNDMVEARLWRSDGTAQGTWPLIFDGTAASMATVGNLLIFWKDHSIWVSDGSIEGTSKLRTFSESFQYGNYLNAPKIVALNHLAFFTAMDETLGPQLWKSDGTMVGTGMVKEFHGAASDLMPEGLVPSSDALYFVPFDAAHGQELWKTDGTEAGTILVKDITQGPTSSGILLMASIDHELYFYRQNDATLETEIWKTNGSEVGTGIVKSTAYLGFRDFTPAGGNLYFGVSSPQGSHDLWKTDGTASGTGVVKTIHPGEAVFAPSDLFAAGDKLYFLSGAVFENVDLWVSDGTELGTNFVKTLVSAEQQLYIGGDYRPSFTAFLGELYLNAMDDTTGMEFWKSNGTPGSTLLVSDIYNGTADGVKGLAKVNEKLVFSGRGLWTSDGTPEVTQLLANIEVLDLPSYAKPFCLFEALGAGTRGLWRTDGTPSGSGMIADFSSAPPGAYLQGSTPVGSEVYFMHGTAASQLWKSNGTELGTKLLKDFDYQANYGPRYPTPHQNKLYFAGQDNAAGNELWGSDGTTAGTQMVVDLTPSEVSPGSPRSSFPMDLLSFGDRLFFSAQSPSGRIVYSSDGTAAGTQPIALPAFGPAFSMGDKFAIFSGTSIWISDGTVAGTQHVTDLPSASGQPPCCFHVIGRKIFFAHKTPNEGWELWMTDGTTVGTKLVKDIYPGSHGSDPQSFCTVGNTLFFCAGDPIHGSELWSTDGTTAGTLMVADITGDDGNSQPKQLRLVGSKLFFTATTNATGRELYVYDLPWNLPEWRQLHFLGRNNEGTAADLADYDGDGLVNLLEYAFGQNPTDANERTLPTGSLEEQAFVIRFDQPMGVTGISYAAECSSMLTPLSWTPVPDTGSAGTHVFSIPVGSAGKMFMRLVVTKI